MGIFSTANPTNPFGYVGPILSDGEQKFAPQTGNTTASAVAALGTTISATTAYNVVNPNCRGAIFYMSVTSMPGSGSTSIALKIKMNTDPIAGAGNVATLGSFGAFHTSGVSAYLVYPTTTNGGLSGVQVLSPLPRNYQCVLSMSTGATSKEVTFSLSVMHLV